jgi:hypothetical protein
MTVRMGNRKQQAAIEYLLVYGIAFLVILIAAGFLYTLYQSPGSRVPNTCTFSGGVTCSDIIIATNTMTGNTAIIALFNNAGDTYIQAPNAIANLNGVNSSAFTCLPNYVRSGGSILCIMNLTSKSAKGTVLSGTIYYTDQNCAFSTSFGSCQTSVVQTYSGKFEGTSQAYNKKPTLGISLTAANTLPPANNQRDQLTATLTLSGTPLKGATINFSTSNPTYQISPKYFATNSTGQALSFIWGPSSGSTIVYANFTNTISANIVLGFGLTAVVPITLSNLQSSATGANFQQMVSFNPRQSTAYTSNEASDLGNLRFFSGPTELYSWCESGCNSITSTNATFWVALPSGINANSNVIINMTFLANTIEYDGVYAGEAPQITCTNPSNTIGGCTAGQYGKYDNGNHVFMVYQNFAGMSLPSGWTGTQPASGTSIYSIANSVTIWQGTFLTTVPVFYAENNVMEDLITLPNGPTGVGHSGESNQGYVAGSNGNNAYGVFYYSNTNCYAANGGPGYNINAGGGCGTLSAATSYIFGFAVSSSVVYWYKNYVPSTTAYSGSFNTNQYIFLGDQHGNGASYASNPEFYQWVRVRTLPPAGVMPTLSFGGITK